MAKRGLKARAEAIVERLKAEYPMADCTLDYDEAWKLLVSVRLAAQCTDARVNEITPVLFERWDISACMKMLRDTYGGRVPDTMDELLKLPGVGRKSANLVMGDVFGKPAIVTDTHCIRLSRRMGLTEEKEPAKVERDLIPLIPPEESNDFCHRLVLHGRAVCSARTKPDCEHCCVNDLCEKRI